MFMLNVLCSEKAVSVYLSLEGNNIPRISRLSGVSIGYCHELVTYFKNKGLITHYLDDIDNRNNIINFTVKGKKLHKQLYELHVLLS